MLKKTITYTDYNGNEQSDDFYFNLSKAELIEMELGTEGGFIESVAKIGKEQNPNKLMAVFKNVVLKAYGEKSEDGKRFVKNDEIREAFEQSAAYDELFTELLTNADSAATFFNGIIPQNI